MPKFNLTEQLASTRYHTDDEDFDELLASPDRLAGQRLIMLPLAKLVEYKDEDFERATGRPQPFRTYSQEDLESLAKSIAEHGVIDPITVRPFDEGKYQIIAGRHRTRASALCGLAEVPGIIRRDIDDVKAAKIMLDTNLEQRHNLLYSEKAYAYRMRMELEGRRGKRTDLEGGGEKVDMLAEIGIQNKDKRRTVADLIRLTYLLPGLLNMVDKGTIGFKVGVQLSHLPAFAQSYLLDTIIPTIPYKKKGKPMQASVLREMQKAGTLTTDSMEEVFRKKQESPVSFSISSKALSGYADLLKDKKEIERLFLEFLESYKHKRGARLCAPGAQSRLSHIDTEVW